MFFDLNGDPYEYYNPNTAQDIDQVDIELSSPSPDVMATMPNSRITVDLEIWDNYENQYVAMVNYISTDYRISNAVDTYMRDPRIIFCDFLFNRTKAYYSNFKFKPTTKKWYWVNDQTYKIPQHPTADCKTRIFVAPNKTWAHLHRKTYWRPRLVDLLAENYHDLGYLGDYHRRQDLVLYPHWEAPECKDIKLLMQHQIQTKHDMVQIKDTNLWGYSPPHNLYYENTFISIYGETIEYGTSIAVTEKTYDPLIKGHFILPFSCAGFVSYLNTLGFQFPTFINYDYDNISNDEKRFASYTNEVRRLLSLQLDTWREHWNNNLDIIRHNQSIFFDRDYDRVDFSKIL